MDNGVPIFHPGADLVSEGGLSARALLKSIRRHRILVPAVVLLFCGIGAIVGLGLPPRYTATGELVVRSQPPHIADVQEVLPGQATDPAAIRSELDVLRSRSLIEQVVRPLGLWRFSEFQPSAHPGGWTWRALEANLTRVWHRVAGSPTDPSAHPTWRALEANLTRVWHRVAGSPTGQGKWRATAPRNDNGPPTPAELDAAIGSYASHLRVENDAQSMTLRVFFTAPTPALAAEIVNTHMEAYRRLYQQDKATAAQRANTWLNGQIARLRDQLQTAEAAVAAYRGQHNLTGTALDHGALSQQLLTLTTQLIAARADLAENEARAAAIRTHTGGTGGGAGGSELATSTTLTTLRAREADLIEREASLSGEFGPNYPPLQRVRSSLRHLRAKIGQETGDSYAAALELVERSRAREQSIARSVVALTNQINSSDAGLRQLQENAESIRSLLRRFQARMEETAAEPALITSQSTIISWAGAGAAAKASIVPFLAGGGSVGLILAALLAVLLDLRNRAFETVAQIEQYIEPTSIGATPRVIRLAHDSPADLVLYDHRSVSAEAFRLSWANIRLAITSPGAPALASWPELDAAATVLRLAGREPGSGRDGIAIGITSAIVGEGKSTHALAFARTVALAGESTVLVDADLRHAGASRLLCVNPEATLRDYLRGRRTLSEVTAVTEPPGMHFIPSSPVETAWTMPDLRRFRELIADLRKRHAVVIVDLPPVLGLAETIHLATMTDGVALIVRWARTDRHLVRMAWAALRNAGVATIAAILNDVDLRVQKRRNYYDHTVAHSLYLKYYG
jgi:uncharacterized protein involved in exopolysaccharide biosynthesis/Mrp family chromosome partitioning ATPase